ncbi:MAG TPA: glycosyltransferase [Mycobacteriales bacterium]|nr:glycosyltransferase [Mycobacteriales bacterium]
MSADPTSLRILHVNVGGERLQVDGIPDGLRRRMDAQRELGHRPEVIDWRAFPDESGAELARRVARTLTGETPPDVVHFYSVFRPVQAALGALAGRRGIPYVVSPASAYAPDALARGRHRKRAFIRAVDGPYVRASRAAVCHTANEVAEVRAALGTRTPTFIVPNDAPLARFPQPVWRAAPGRPVLLCLARHDVWHKGLDVLAQIAQRLPEADVVVHGQPDGNDPGRARALQAAASPNFFLLPPIFDAEKRSALAGAALYVQTSRYESTSNAVLEAMAAGVPLAVSSYIGEEMHLRRHDAGLVLDDEPAVAAAQLRAALADVEQRRRWADAARRLAARHYDPLHTAQLTIDMYRGQRCPSRTAVLERS